MKHNILIKITTFFITALLFISYQFIHISPIKASAAENPKQYIVITNKITELDYDGTYTFRIKCVGIDNPSILWSSSDQNIATVSEDGLVTAKKAGNVKIIAKDSNTGKASACYFRVRGKETNSSYFRYRIENKKAIIISYNGPSNLSRIVIPRKFNDYTIAEIDDYAFYSNTSIKAVDFPSTITKIGDYVFYQCNALNKITLPSKLTYLGEGAFASCTSLTTCTFPKTMNTMKGYIFNNCPALSQVTFPTRCTNIGEKILSATPYSHLCNIQIAQATGSNIFLNDTDKKVYKKMKSVIQEIITEDDTDVEKVKKIHDWIITNSTYDLRIDSGTLPDISYTCNGLILNKTAVCAGYAEAFDIFMNFLGIDCEIMSGKSGGVNHAWNSVKLDDEWYQVDVTFDDPTPDTGDISYAYFLVTDDIMAKDHSWKSTLFPAANGTAYMYYAYEDYLCENSEQIRNVIQEQKQQGIEWITVVCPSTISFYPILSDYTNGYSYYEPYSIGSYLVYRVKLNS